MRAVALVALLFVAGTCALPASEVATPSENRIVDLWMIDFLQRMRNWVIDNNLDPVNKERHDFNVTIINELVEITGFVENLKFTGLSKSRVNSISYNILFGRLDIDVELIELYLSVGKYSVNIRYGNTDVNLELSGTVVINSIRLSGNAVMSVSPGAVFIININPDLRIGGIKSDLKVRSGSEDHSEAVNDFINRRIVAFFITYRNEINTIIGEIIRQLVNIWW